MPGNSFGEIFRITTFGESHGGSVGAVVDGCPPGLALSESDLQPELDRRKPGQSAITTPRKEEDTISILSGVFEGKTTGTPILLIAHNKDQRSQDYAEMKEILRPSHADYTYLQKYGIRDFRGSGRASARETLARVAAGAIAKKFLRERCETEILAYVSQVGAIKANKIPSSVSSVEIEANQVRCPDSKAAQEMIALIEKMRDEGDSVGGIIQGVVKNCPAGLGEPVFDKLHADIGKGLLSINAVKGVEFGSGFDVVSFKGSTHNDPYIARKDGTIGTSSNNAGGILGGISTGEEILFRVAFKPVATIAKAQQTTTVKGESCNLAAKGRHDPCVLPRAVPIVEAMTALTLIDHYLRSLTLARKDA